jgi:hypothetical protein
MTTKHILSGSIELLTLALPAFAATAAKKADPKPAAEASALTFANGLVTLDIEERLRWEVRDNNRDFDRSVNDVRDDGWLLSRFRLGLAIKPGSWLKLYAQVQDTREWFGQRGNVPGINGVEGGDYFDLRQAYLEFGDFKQFPLSVTVGRQVLTYGDSRLVADSKWGNFGRTFDGVKLRLQTGKFWVDAFAVRPVQIRKNEFNDSDSADNFFGIYGGTDALGFQTTELYFLYRDKADAQPDLDPTNKTNANGSYNGPAQRIGTLGTRWKSKAGELHGFDYSAEFAYQFGDLWTGAKTTPRLSHHAFALALTGGYTWEDAPWKPRLGLEYDYASGDKNPKDGSSQSFQNLFPSNHANYGFMDTFGWRNLHDLRLSLSAKPLKNVEVTLDYHAFWLAETTDYAYGSNGNGTGRTTTPSTTATVTTTKKGVTTTKKVTTAGKDVRTIGANNFAGHEVDLTTNWKVNKHLSFLVGYSHFFAGPYLRDTGASSDADFGYLQATLSF